MYRAFNVKLDDPNWQKFATNYNYDDLSNSSREILKKVVNSSQKISADKIKEILIPRNPYDIFISHSHKDLNLAKGLAGYLQKYCKVSCFIDSLYWGNIDDLQNEVNELHLTYDDTTRRSYYDYEKTLQVAKHANMILASALTEMIDCCECVFFLNTDNSVIRGTEAISKNETYSPWIYHEVFTTSIIRSKPRLNLNEHYQMRDSAMEQLPDISYALDLSGMTILREKDVLNWGIKAKSSNMYPLDVLYKLKPERK